MAIFFSRRPIKIFFSRRHYDLTRFLNDEKEYLRYSYKLNQNSVVFDLGGYKGDFSEKIFERFQCNLFIFEPIKHYYQIIKSKFENNTKAKVYNFGLSDKNTHTTISICEDGSSTYREYADFGGGG